MPALFLYLGLVYFNFVVISAKGWPHEYRMTLFLFIVLKLPTLPSTAKLRDKKTGKISGLKRLKLK